MEARKHLPEISRRKKKRHVKHRSIIAGPNDACVRHTCGKQSNFTLDDLSVRHRDDAEDLAGDGNMRTVIDRSSDRRSFAPTDYK